MSDQQGCIENNCSRRIIFRGTGKGYFLILIVNLLLMVVTFGFFTPWAIVRAKRYLYSNTELSGSSFSYNVTGASILISWLFLLIYIFVTEAALLTGKSSLAMCLIAILVLFVPYLIMQSLRYQMQSTALNGVRFNFKSNGFKAWWVMIGCPLLMFVVLVIICAIFSSIISLPVMSYDLSRIMITAAVSFIIGVLGSCVVQGVTVGLWLNLFFNGLSFGTQNFVAQVSIKKCILIFFIGMLILIPFLIAVMALFLPDYLKLLYIAMSGSLEDMLTSSAMRNIQNTIVLCYVIYFVGALCCFSYLYVTLRNYYFNTVMLSGKIAFRSTLTLSGFVIQLMVNIFITVCTFGIGYPWARIRYCHYMANNTWVEGDLDELDLQDHNDKIATDIVSRLSRGLVPNISL